MMPVTRNQTVIQFKVIKLILFNKNKYRGGTSDATTPSSLIVPLFMMSIDNFLDAPSHLYKRVCPSVCPSVGPYVRPLALSKNRWRTHLIARPGLFCYMAELLPRLLKISSYCFVMFCSHLVLVTRCEFPAN